MSYPGNKAIRIQSDEVAEAKIFIEFGPLVIRSKIHTSMKDTVPEDDSKANYMNVPAAIKEPEKIGGKLGEIDGMIIPGGFGSRGTEGMILAAQYARINGIPFLGICLGMQMALVEFARNVVGWKDANSSELDPETFHPVIYLMPEQEGVTQLGGTMRLGAYPCAVQEGTLARQIYGQPLISERHRHRYELNNRFVAELQAAGLRVSGINPESHLAEIVEIPLG